MGKIQNRTMRKDIKTLKEISAKYIDSLDRVPTILYRGIDDAIDGIKEAWKHQNDYFDYPNTGKELCWIPYEEY